MKTLFVTGAEGFLGQHLVARLIERGYEVVGGVRNRARKLAFEKKHGRAVVCEVADAINVARAIASLKPDGVIHLAGPSQPWQANNEPLEAYQAIVSGWANVLDGVRRSAPRARVLLASSSDVYGSASGDQPLRENDNVQPVSTFGSLKATAESMARTYYRNFHLNLTIVRPFQYVGGGMPLNSFFGAFAQKAIDWNPSTQGPTIALTDLDCVRDVLHVEDVADAYVTLLEEGRPNAAYNVCSGNALTVRDICKTIIAATGRDLSLAGAPSNDEQQIRRLVGDNSQLKDSGWTPKRTLENAIHDLVAGVRGGQAAVAVA